MHGLHILLSTFRKYGFRGSASCTTIHAVISFAAISVIFETQKLFVRQTIAQQTMEESEHSGVACRMGEEDSTGPSRHLQIRTMQDLCSGWLILHKVCLPLHYTQRQHRLYLNLLLQRCHLLHAAVLWLRTVNCNGVVVSCSCRSSDEAAWVWLASMLLHCIPENVTPECAQFVTSSYIGVCGFSVYLTAVSNNL